MDWGNIVQNFKDNLGLVRGVFRTLQSIYDAASHKELSIIDALPCLKYHSVLGLVSQLFPKVCYFSLVFSVKSLDVTWALVNQRLIFCWTSLHV